MAGNRDDFTPETIDEQIEHFLQHSELRQQAPAAALTHMLKVVCEEDAASLQRVEERYAARLQTLFPEHIQGSSLLPERAQDSTQLPPPIRQKRTFMLNDIQEKQKPEFVYPSGQREISWKRRGGLLAAVLCVVFLVGGFIVLASAVHAPATSQVGSRGVNTPTPKPTPNSVAAVVSNVILTTYSPGTSKGEGVGPGCANLTPKTHFTVGQKILLCFMATTTQSGQFTVKWFANGHLWNTSSARVIVQPGKGTPGPTPTPKSGAIPTPGPGSSSAGPFEVDFTVSFPQPASAKMELFWNDSPLVTMNFTVTR